MVKEQNETYPIYVRSINTLNPEEIKFQRVGYITILTMNLLPHQPFSHTSHEMLSAEPRKRNHASQKCNTKSNIEKAGFDREVEFHFFWHLYKV